MPCSICSCANPPALCVYPPLVEAIPQYDRSSPLSHYAVTLILQLRASGELERSTLRLPWYDAARNQLASVVVVGQTLTVFDPRWLRARQVACGLAGVLLLAGPIWQGHRMMRWRLARWRGLRTIRQTENIVALAQAVRQFSLHGHPVSPSLGEWLRRLRNEKSCTPAAAAVRQLEQRQFGRAAPDLSALRQAFMTALLRVRPRSNRRCLRSCGRV